MTASGKKRIAVFIDWQNAYMTAREAFDLVDLPGEVGNFSPLGLARILASGNGRGTQGYQLVRVFVHRGRPSQAKDPQSYAANRRQAAAWENELPGVVFARMRPLRYPPTYPDDPPVEKGIDVDLAVLAFETILMGHADIAIVMSHDTDLAPVPEAIARISGAERVETASWAAESFHSRIRIKGHTIFHHEIPGNTFNSISTPFKYGATADE